MKHLKGIAAVAVALAALLTGAVRAADLTEAVILVASAKLDGSPLQQTVIVAAPLPDGGHLGFIVNRPTKVTLDQLFPDDTSARNVTEPVYVGGPVMSNTVFAVASSVPEGNAIAIPLLPDLVAVLDGTAVDRIIATTPNAARYYVGLMTWDFGELNDQIRSGLWEVRPADLGSVLPSKSPGLWNALRSPMARNDESLYLRIG